MLFRSAAAGASAPAGTGDLSKCASVINGTLAEGRVSLLGIATIAIVTWIIVAYIEKFRNAAIEKREEEDKYQDAVDWEREERRRRKIERYERWLEKQEREDERD